MTLRPAIAGDRTVYTSELAGATLEELLEAAADDCWPNNQCDAEWVLLRNWAIQTESLIVDEAENREWSQQMRELAAQRLPYLEWIEARGEALKARTRARKLAQARIRDKFGFKRPRRWGLVVLTRIVVDVGETSVVELELSRFPRVRGGLSCLTVMPG